MTTNIDTNNLHKVSLRNFTLMSVNVSNVTVFCTNEYCIPDEEYLDMIEEYIFPNTYEWVLIAFHAIVFIVGLVGNALVCISVYRNRSMRTVTNYFIVNLAIADFLVILVCLPPTVLWDVTETWFFGRVMCKLVLYLQSVSVSVSVLTLAFISIDRWYAICYPLRFKSNAFKAKASIAIIWMISLLIILPEAIVLDIRPYTNLRVETLYLTDCDYTWSDDDTTIYQLIIMLALYVGPFILMTLAYYRIAKVLWNKNIPGSVETSSQNVKFQKIHRPNVLEKKNGRNGAIRFTQVNQNCVGQIRSRRKAAKMLIAVVIMFGVCYLPVHLLNTLRYTTGLPQNHFTTVASLISHWLCYANSAINPIIYNFMNGKFRKEFRNSFSSSCYRRSRIRSHHTATYLCRNSNSMTVTQFETINLNSIAHNS